MFIMEVEFCTWCDNYGGHMAELHDYAIMTIISSNITIIIIISYFIIVTFITSVTIITIELVSGGK